MFGKKDSEAVENAENGTGSDDTGVVDNPVVEAGNSVDSEVMVQVRRRGVTVTRKKSDIAKLKSEGWELVPVEPVEKA